MGMYYKNDVTKDWLHKNGFKYDGFKSTVDNNVYSKRFPIYKYIGITVLEGCISINESDGDVQVDVYENCNTYSPYPPYYDREYGTTKEVIDIAEKKIFWQLKKLKINKRRNIKYGKKNCKV